MEVEIENWLVIKMVNRAQRFGITVERNGENEMVMSIHEIGEAFSKNKSVEFATKINQIIYEDNNIRSRYEYEVEKGYTQITYDIQRRMVENQGFNRQNSDET